MFTGAVVSRDLTLFCSKHICVVGVVVSVTNNSVFERANCD